MTFSLYHFGHIKGDTRKKISGVVLVVFRFFLLETFDSLKNVILLSQNGSILFSAAGI